nr:unnamed protein product [Spirometra erinaceieuropaei]
MNSQVTDQVDVSDEGGVDGAVVGEGKSVHSGCGYVQLEVHPPLIEEVIVRPVGDADPGAFVTVGAHQRGREHKAEEGGHQDAPLFHYAGHRECSVFRDARHHAAVGLTRLLGASLETVGFLHDLPQSFKIHRDEGFCHINEGRVHASPHLLALILKLTGGEYHVYGPAMAAEAALSFRKKTLF